MANYNELQRLFTVNSYPNRNITFIKGEEVYLFSDTGERYLDMMSNYGVNIFGYKHNYLTNALIEQLNKLTTLHCSFSNDIRAIASKKLINKVNNGCRYVYWANSGAEAIEAALKFAVLATDKKKFIACKHSYHGKTLGALSVTYAEKYKKAFLPLLWDIVYIDYNNASALEAAIDSETAGFIVEPIQGESGVIIPNDSYLKEIENVCRQRKILLILDEIQTGCGRTGKFLSSQYYKIKPDIICLGKGLGGGIPVGAAIISIEVARYITKSIHTSTFGGNPLACAGANVIIDLLTEDILYKIDELGKYFINSLKKINSELIIEVRGKGLMIGIEVKEKRNEIMQKLQDNKIIVAPAGDNVVRFLPPYIIEKDHINLVINKIDEILKSF